VGQLRLCLGPPLVAPNLAAHAIPWHLAKVLNLQLQCQLQCLHKHQNFHSALAY